MKSKPKFSFFLSLLMFLWALTASASGFMEVRNFPREQYSGGPQNWVMIQDSVGTVYIGNRDGMLNFDGERWNKYLLPNHTTVRSLMYDATAGRIYAGGTEEFGYFAPKAPTGALAYTSLLGSVGKQLPRFTEIWNIHRLGSKILFQGDNHIFIYDGTTTRAIPTPARISSSAIVGEMLILGFDNGTLATLTDNSLTALPGTSIIAGKKIQAIVPGMGLFMIATPFDGLFYYDGREVRRFNNDINAFLSENQLFSVARDGSDVVFGTVAAGAVIKNFNTGRTTYVNKTNGLQNNTVLNASFDKSGNVWLCLDNGIAYAVYNSPMTNIIGNANDVGAGYASLHYGDRIYFGTNQGLFSTPYPFTSSPEPLPLHRELIGQIWTTTEYDGGFFVSGDAGLHTFDGRGFVKVEGLTGTHKVMVLPGDKNSAISSSYDGFHLLRRHDGTWTDEGLIPGAKEVRGEFFLDDNNNLWLTHWLKGVYRLHYNAGLNRFDLNRLYALKDGLPTQQNNSLAIFNGRPVIMNDSGFYSYDRTTDRIIPDKTISSVFSHKGKGSLHIDEKGMVLIDDEGVRVAAKDSRGNYNARLTVANLLTDKLVNGFEDVQHISPNEVIVANQNGFWSLNPHATLYQRWTPRPIVSAIYANNDSLVYRAGFRKTDGTTLTLPYSLNSLRIEFACPEFHAPGEVQYSSYLENYDKTWSPYALESSREYTQLSEGTYTLHLRALNRNTGEAYETSMLLRITPPWYRSVVAIVIYLLLFLGAICCVVYVLQKWKRNAERNAASKKEEELYEMRARSEREALKKDYEISKLKSEQLEVDVRHKSDELSNATMSLIRKNEILSDIASRIAKIHKMSALDRMVTKQLESIQNTIKECIDNDNDRASFNRSFDVVYGDYTKRLRERYPQLTPADMRLACYIRMGLASKEIAPLINISYKSVEMARYRLRKKLELEPDASLSEFLANF